MPKTTQANDIDKLEIDKAENFAVDLVLDEIKEYDNGFVEPAPGVYFSQKEALRIIRTHQNHGFLTPLGEGQEDNRDFFDIITRMVDTGVKKADIDTKDFTMESLNGENQAEVFLAQAELKNYLKNTNQSEKINSQEESFWDDGNVVSRKVEGAEIYKQVRLDNLCVIDQTAESLEDTTVIERQEMSLYGLRKMTEWKQLNKVTEYCNKSRKHETPYYEALMRFGQLSKYDLERIKAYLDGETSNPNPEDKDVFVESQIIVVRAFNKKGLNAKQKGFVVFAEELQPEKIKVTPKLTITKYKPYCEAHLGAYTGTWLREGYRLKGVTHQNRANEIGNQIKDILEDAAKLVWWSKDKNVAGKNILANLGRGDILIAEHLELLNNLLPNISYLINEWNRNLSDCKETMQAFEVATGEALPSTTSATAVSIQSQGSGEYYDFKREKLGIYFREVYNRWVMTKLLEDINAEHVLEISGDPEYLTTYFEALSNSIANKMLISAALNGRVVGPEEYTMAKEFSKEQLSKNLKNLMKVNKDYFKDASMYLDINITNEQGNRQNKVNNALSLSDRYANQAYANPQSKRLLDSVSAELGFIIDKSTPEPVQQAIPAGGTPEKGGQIEV